MMVVDRRSLVQPWDIPMHWRLERMQATPCCGKLTTRTAACDRALSHVVGDLGPPPHGCRSLFEGGLRPRHVDTRDGTGGQTLDTCSLIFPARPPARLDEGRPPTPEYAAGAEEGQQYVGVVTKIRWQRGYAFVDCPEARSLFATEVYVARSRIPEGMRVGDRVIVTLAAVGDRPSALRVVISF
mmetsp:Transcript_62105/g.171748  ORF Transcript_62105/g.171748 Transcript_62105/m.171748 type:complete len:184 (-) Transcript_62105:3-554(-)